MIVPVFRLSPVPSSESSSILLSKDMHGTINMKLGLIVLGMLLAAAVIFHAVWTIQIKNHEINLAEADSIMGFPQKVIGERGKIFDINRNLLVGNDRTKDLYIIPVYVTGTRKPDLEKLNDFIDFLAEQLDVPPEKIRSKALEIINREVAVQVAAAIPREKAALLWSISIPGVDVAPSKTETTLDANDGRTPLYWDISFRPESIKDDEDRDAAISYMEEVLELQQDSLFRKVIRAMGRQTPILAAARISIDQAERLELSFSEWNRRIVNGKLTKKCKIKPEALYFEDSTRRCYPQETLMANLLGFCDVDNKGLSGIERLMDKEMQASSGFRRRILGQYNIRNFLPKHIYDNSCNGNDIYLTIQLPIQQVVETSMERLVREHSPKRAYMVMMNPRTGAIMALAQHPGFIRNPPQGGSHGSREFHALVTGYEPGSIMKGPTVSSAMDYANLTPDTEIYCENGRWLFAGRYLKEHGRARFGDLKIRDIIKKSSNIGSAKAVIENMEPNVFYSYLRSFGFGQKTRMGFFPENRPPVYFEGESDGILKSVENWYKIDISRIAIGHSILVTPLQMVQAYGALANNGEMMQPYIVDRVVTSTGEVISSVPFRKSQPLNEAAVKKILECLCATVERGGTGTKGAVDGYTVAAKTGTAMKPVRGPNGKFTYSGRHNTASFIGFVPAEDPAFVLLVTADEPQGPEQYGGSVCGDHFAEIAEETLKILQISPNELPGEPATANNY